MGAPPAGKPSRRSPTFPIWFGLAATLVFCGLVYSDPYHAISDLESKWGDVMFRVRGTQPAFPKLQIVAIDDYSISAIGPFPWKRGVHAQILRKLARLGVKTVGFDVLFLDPRPDDPKGDADLVKATQETGRAIHLVNISAIKAGGKTYVTLDAPKLSGLLEASAVVAHPNVQGFLDRDGILRRASLYDYTTNDPVALLGSALWMHYTDHSIDDLGAFPDPLLLNMRGRVHMPTDAAATHTGGAFHFVHAASLFQRKQELGLKADLGDLEHDSLTEAERQNFKGGLVLIGATAVGAFDHYPSPFEEQTPGVIFHANVFDNLLRGDWLRPAPQWVGYLLIVLLVWFAVWLIHFEPWLGASIAVAVTFVLAAADYGLFLKRGLRLDFVAPAAAFLATYGGLLIHKVILEGREKKWIKNTFGQYLSPKVVEALVRNPDKLQLGGEKRDMTIFFLDIAHFTNISEKLTPEQLTEFLNEYLSALTDIILKNDGVVDKFIGDCVMAFWNAPVDQPRHKELACLSAVECLAAIERLNREFIKGDFPEMPAIRIGLNSGKVVVGNMGSRSRFSYTVIGDEVNLASRLEGANKFFGSHVMASESVASAAMHLVETRELGRVRVVGKATPIRVFELLAKKGELPPDKKKAYDQYAEGIGCYNTRKFAEAGKLFEEVSKVLPNDKVTKLYLSACQDYELIPPSDDWDGVFNLTSK